MPQGDFDKMQKGLLKAKAERKREDKLAPKARVAPGPLPPSDLSKIGMSELLDEALSEAV